MIYVVVFEPGDKNSSEGNWALSGYRDMKVLNIIEFANSVIHFGSLVILRSSHSYFSTSSHIATNRVSGRKILEFHYREALRTPTGSVHLRRLTVTMIYVFV